MFADAHAHIDFCSRDDLPGMLSRCHEADVGIIICVAMNQRSSEKIGRLIETYPEVYGGVGIHPWEEELATLTEPTVYGRLKELAAHPKVVCISEVGLDYTRSPHSKEMQMQRLRDFVRLARETHRPLNTHHDNDSGTDMLTVLREEGAQEVGGIIHGFRGDWEYARQCLNLGFYLSCGRSVTQPDGQDVLDVVHRAPRDRLLLETDTSGRDNSGPYDIVAVAERLSQALGMSPQEVGDLTTANLKTLFRI